MNVLAALVLSVAVGSQLYKEGLSVWKILFITAVSICCFFVGSRVLYGLLYPQKILDDPGKLFEIKLVNFSLYGGLIASFMGWYLLTNHYKLPFMKLNDHIVPALGVAIALSKMGCFFNGCCYGIQTHLPWGVVFDRADQSPVTKAFGNNPFIRMISGSVNVPRHPAQLYEVFFALMAAYMAYRLVKSSGKYNKVGMPTLVFVSILTVGRWLSFTVRDFPNATAASNFVRGPLTYGLVLGVCVFWFYRLNKKDDKK